MSGRRTRPTANVGSPIAQTPIDLREPSPQDWHDRPIDPDRPMAVIARRVAEGLETLTERIVVDVSREIAAYAGPAVPDEDLAASVSHNLEAILLGLAEGRGPRPDELAVRRELGTRRAHQGMPVDAVIQAYHVGYRELWLALVAALDPDDDAEKQALLTAATTAWQWVHEVTTALASAHAAAVRSLEAREVGARQRLVELLVAGDLDGDEARRLGAALGFDVRGRFGVVAIRGTGDDLDAVHLQHALQATDGRHAVSARGPLTLVVSQVGGPETEVDLPEPAHQVVTAGRELFPTAAIAAGAVRRGLRGARASLEDAERTLSVLEDGQTGTFDESWLWATLAGVDERLAPLLRRGRTVAGEHPHLAEAVHAFAEADFSVSEASRRLALHANTVAYRLDRWEELTGWDPRSFAGLVRSVAALRLGDRHDRGERAAVGATGER